MEIFILLVREFGMLASKYHAPIVPVYVSGSSAIGRKLSFRGVKIIYGKPFNIEDLNLGSVSGKDLYQKISLGVMQKIAEVGGVKPPE